jgi:acetyl esterase
VPLDPQVQQLLDQMAAIGMPPLSSLPVDEGRKALDAFREMNGPGEDVAAVEDRLVPGPGGDIPVRIYRPEAGTTLPVVVFFHGGGWVLGNIETHDGTCRALANRSGAVVVSVDYRLAPEAPFPAAVDDCITVTRWVHANGAELGVDPSRLAVAGDSAGGNLAAVVSLAARDGGPAIAFQLLIYPAVDAHMTAASIKENGEGYFLTETDMVWFYGHYAPDRDDWRASPLLAKDLSGLPPALVITAGYDPLRDEGEAYAERLREAGVEVTLKREPDLVHGFINAVGLSRRAREAMTPVAEAIRQQLR